MKLRPGDRILAAWGKRAKGPGWANRLVWVLVRSPVGALETYSVQQDECSETMLALLDVSATVNTAMIRAVTTALEAPDG